MRVVESIRVHRCNLVLATIAGSVRTLGRDADEDRLPKLPSGNMPLGFAWKVFLDSRCLPVRRLPSALNHRLERLYLVTVPFCMPQLRAWLCN